MNQNKNELEMQKTIACEHLRNAMMARDEFKMTWDTINLQYACKELHNAAQNYFKAKYGIWGRYYDLIRETTNDKEFLELVLTFEEVHAFYKNPDRGFDKYYAAKAFEKNAKLLKKLLSSLSEK